MTEYVHRCMIVAAEHVQFARDLAAHLAPEAGSDMFLTPLSPTGQEPATHYVSSGMVGVEFTTALVNANVLWQMAQVAEETGMQLPQGGFGIQAMSLEIEAFSLIDCQNVVAAADVSEEQPFEAFARLGLKIVQDAESE